MVNKDVYLPIDNKPVLRLLRPILLNTRASHALILTWTISILTYFWRYCNFL